MLAFRPCWDAWTALRATTTALPPLRTRIYFAPDYGTSLDFVLGSLDPELGCNGGYAVSESLPVTLTATDSAMTWVLDDVAQTLIDNGFDIVVSDLTTQALSCAAAT